jgi:hypothetical protein
MKYIYLPSCFVRFLACLVVPLLLWYVLWTYFEAKKWRLEPFWQCLKVNRELLGNVDCVQSYITNNTLTIINYMYMMYVVIHFIYSNIIMFASHIIIDKYLNKLTFEIFMAKNISSILYDALNIWIYPNDIKLHTSSKQIVHILK